MVNEVQDISGTVETQNVEDVPSNKLEGLAKAVLEDKEPVKERTEDEEPNVILAASAKDRALNEGPVIIGRTQIDLPSLKDQEAGFYVQDAPLLVTQYPQYKFKREKGSSKNVPNADLR